MYSSISKCFKENLLYIYMLIENSLVTVAKALHKMQAVQRMNKEPRLRNSMMIS